MPSVISLCFEGAKIIAFMVSLYGLDGEVGRGLLGYVWLLIGYLEDVKIKYGKYRIYSLAVLRGESKWRKLMLMLLSISTVVNIFVLTR